jgi:hypothetical protein
MNAEPPQPKSAKVNEKQLRAMLARKARELGKFILSKRCRDLFAEQANRYAWLYDCCKAEADFKRKRKRVSPGYAAFCQTLLATFAEKDLGPLRDLPQDKLATLEKLWDALIAGLAGRKPPELTGSDLASLTKYLLVPKKKPGPQFLSKYDTAFVRRAKGEKLSDIIKDLEPDEYVRDPYATTQRYSAAIRLRKRQASRI